MDFNISSLHRIVGTHDVVVFDWSKVTDLIPGAASSGRRADTLLLETKPFLQLYTDTGFPSSCITSVIMDKGKGLQPFD